MGILHPVIIVKMAMTGRTSEKFRTRQWFWSACPAPGASPQVPIRGSSSGVFKRKHSPLPMFSDENGTGTSPAAFTGSSRDRMNRSSAFSRSSAHAKYPRVHDNVRVDFSGDREAPAHHVNACTADRFPQARRVGAAARGVDGAGYGAVFPGTGSAEEMEPFVHDPDITRDP